MSGGIEALPPRAQRVGRPVPETVRLGQAPAKRRERSRTVPVSALHEIHALVERSGDVIALHVGEPHIRMPEEAKDAFARAMRDGRTSYTDAPGQLALREDHAARHAAEGDFDPDRIFVTPGSCQAIAAVLASVAYEGAGALLPEIHWPMHLQQVYVAGLTPRFHSAPQPGMSYADVLDAAVHGDGRPDGGAGADIRVLVVNSPANPSGRLLTESELRDLHAWAVRHRVWVIADEAYEDFVYEGRHVPLSVLDAELPPAERVVFSVHTFSKGFSMTGCRLGYVAAPTQERADLLRRVQEATLVAPCTPVQYAGMAALTASGHLREHRDYVRRTRDEVVAATRDAGVLWEAPAGGWYALLDLSAFSADTDALCRRLLDEAGVAVAPGRGFLPAGRSTGRSLVRVSLCADREGTREGIERLLRGLTAL